LEPKHAIKQVDRLRSNVKLDLWELFPSGVRFLRFAERTEVVVALDWTDFDSDGHATIALHTMTSHGRATPLMWKTHSKAKLLNHRNGYEDELLSHLRDCVPAHVKVTVLTDRGFGDQALYSSLAKGMKESWCLATSRDDLTASQVIALYQRRFTIEESFRDTKDPRFGLGMSATRVGTTVGIASS